MQYNSTLFIFSIALSIFLYMNTLLSGKNWTTPRPVLRKSTTTQSISPRLEKVFFQSKIYTQKIVINHVSRIFKSISTSFLLLFLYFSIQYPKYSFVWHFQSTIFRYFKTILNWYF